MVEGYFHISNSMILSEEQKAVLQNKLSSKINSEGFLQVRSQVHRSQVQNKEEVVRKTNELIEKALKKEKKRVATKPSRAVKEKRLESKKRQSDTKQSRQKIRRQDYRP